jgi:serine phosphatase RsbU (regulator of sigma subunit)
VPDPVIEDRSVELEPGDVIVLYTDGLTDAGAPERLMTIGDLEAALVEVGDRSAEDIAAALEGLAVAAGEGSPRDDLAIVVLRYTG